MAIISDYIGFRNAFYPLQYIRIDKATIVNKNTIVIDAGIYLTQQQAADGFPPHTVETYSGEYDLLSDANPWQQGYQLLKTIFPNYTDEI